MRLYPAQGLFLKVLSEPTRNLLMSLQLTSEWRLNLAGKRLQMDKKVPLNSKTAVRCSSHEAISGTDEEKMQAKQVPNM